MKLESMSKIFSSRGARLGREWWLGLGKQKTFSWAAALAAGTPRGLFWKEKKEKKPWATFQGCIALPCDRNCGSGGSELSYLCHFGTY